MKRRKKGRKEMNGDEGKGRGEKRKKGRGRKRGEVKKGEKR